MGAHSRLAAPVSTATLVLAMCATAPIQAEAPSFEKRKVLFVPDLSGEVAAGIGLLSRLPLGGDDELLLPSTAVAATLGYRHFLDDVGRFGVGGYLSGGLSLPDSAHPAAGRLRLLGGGLTFQFRAMNDEYLYLVFGSFVEANMLTWDTRADPLVSEPMADEGFRLVFGIETGPGLLWFLHPYLFGESTVQFGLEYVRFGSAELTSVLLGWRLTIDTVLH